ncbi:FecR family protein [Pedobacter sp.]|uniref:FecR family protein n=1 Tax=Pedobacter sp. TaxID=1411316 RepID=UPI003D7F42C9
MNKEQAKELLDKYNKGLANAEEKLLLENWYLQESGTQVFSDENADFLFLKEEIWKGTRQKAGLEGVKKAVKWKPYSRIAAVLALIACCTCLYIKIAQRQQKEKNFIAASKIIAGRNQAILTLADGSKVLLNDAPNGTIAKQAGLTVTKTKDGELVYLTSATTQADAPPAYHRVETPKGGQYQVILPDGTHVWLNAASSLRYPPVFKGSARTVQVTGEAYFEVTKDPKKPFRVESDNQIIEVLGTQFNINAYKDEPRVTTTLLEGSVKILNLKNNATVLLNPGEQSALSSKGLRVTHVDPEQFVAWKNDKFIFTNANIESIMRQVSRWYNVTVEYRGDMSEEKFGGRTSRFSNLAELLEIIELTDHVHFEIEGRRIIVMR